MAATFDVFYELLICDFIFCRSKKREREFKVTIKFASQTDLNHLTQFLRRLQLDCPYETIQALDIALRATPSEM